MKQNRSSSIFLGKPAPSHFFYIIKALLGYIHYDSFVLMLNWGKSGPKIIALFLLEVIEIDYCEWADPIHLIVSRR